METCMLSSWIKPLMVRQHSPQSDALQVAQANIDRLTRDLKCAPSPEMRLSDLSYILIHLLTKAEELDRGQHPEFLNAVLHIHGLRRYLEQMNYTDTIKPHQDRINLLEQISKRRYIVTIFDGENTSDSPQPTRLQRINTLAYDSFAYEQLAHTLAKNHDHKGARTNRLNALQSLIQWAQIEKAQGTKERAARALFKARILLMYFDDTDEEKQRYLRSLQETWENVPTVCIKTDLALTPIVRQTPV